MSDAAVVGRVLREYYARGIDPAALRRAGGSVHAASVSYLVRQDGARAWMVRACRADAPGPAHVSGAAVTTMLDWLLAQARTLDWLEAEGYPAPRVIRTRSGDPVGTDGVWLTLATTFVEGPLIRPSLAQLGMLGAALGRLHALEVAGGGGAGEAGGGGVGGPGGGAAGGLGRGGAGGPGSGGAGGPGRASRYPGEAIAAMVARLDAVEPLVPGDWQPLYAQLHGTARAVQRGLGSLPRGVVHGDAWPGNAVQSGPDTVTLIDWEASGLGLPLLDLGHCLIESLLDAEPAGQGPGARQVEPDGDRVAAVARGYAAQRELGPAEQALLPEAVRFAACYAGAVHLCRALAEGVRGTSMDARLERLRNRVAVSGDVARLAAPHLGGAETVR